ncbi:MAG: sigma-70 family RNA polymerase sigma factor [Chitinophagaceae bacterium]
MRNPNTYQHLTDQELLQLFYSDRNQELLGQLLQRYTLLLFGVCMKYLKHEELAKDGVQQVFLKALQEVPRYEITYFKSWLYMVAKNYCLMHLRDHNKHIPDELKEQHSRVLPQDDEKEEKKEKENLMELIEQGLETLNSDQKTCVTLFYLQKKSYQEISDATGLTMMLVKSHIQNGKRNIKIWVERRR